VNGRIPLFDLGRQWPPIRDEALAVYERIAATGAFSLGEELASFESEFAAYCGTTHCVGLANGTVAIELALRALGAGPGRDVVTVAHTFVATVEAIAATGARPVLVDVDPETRCMDPDALAGVLTDRTVAVVPVHLYGRPAPLRHISAVLRCARSPARRGRGAGARRDVRGQEDRELWCRRLLLVLSDEEPRRDGRRRSGGHR
jgi:dTDP-4-amino-4,6-dideoxygalactose transaminase